MVSKTLWGYSTKVLNLWVRWQSIKKNKIKERVLIRGVLNSTASYSHFITSK